MKLEQFLKDLGSKKGAPGGGAAAALTGASGSALVEMVARLNDVRTARLTKTAGRAEGLRQKLQRLIGEDARVFLVIRSLYKKRKENGPAWQQALKKGVAVPLKICEACVDSGELARAEKDRTSRWLESDRQEALILLRAAFDSANLNVEVNLKEMTDGLFCGQMRQRIKKWRRQLQKS